MKTEVISTEYKDGQRIDTVKYTYTKSDDYIRLGDLYRALGQATDTKVINNLIGLIKGCLELIKGYGDANAATTSAE